MSNVQATVGARIWISTNADLTQLRRELTYRNPDREAAIRAKLPADYLPEEWCGLIEYDDGNASVPRGAWRSVQAWAEVHGHSVRWESRVSGQKGAAGTSYDDMGVQPRPYQRDAVEEAIRAQHGIIVLPCGGGKTTVGSILAARIGRGASVLAPTRDIVEQWRGTLDRVGVRLVDGVPGPGEAYVSTIGGCRLDALDAPVLLCDECHHGPATTWWHLVNQSSSRWRIGLTATLERSDGWEVMFPLMFGPVLYEKTQRELVALGHLWAPLIIPVAGSWDLRVEDRVWTIECKVCGEFNCVDGAEWPASVARCEQCSTPLPGTIAEAGATSARVLYSRAAAALHASEAHRSLVADLGILAVKAGMKTLVLVPTKDLGRVIEERINERGVRAVFVSGETSNRESQIGMFRDGEVECLVATQLADEGLDVPDLDCVVNGAGGKAKGRAVQRAGRACRPSGTGQPVVLDVVHRGVWHNQWKDRRVGYIEAFGRKCVASARPLSVAEVTRIVSGLR